MRSPAPRVLAFVALCAFVFAVPASSAPAPVRDWTVLVWLNADNDLDPFGVKDLAEMQKVGSTAQVNVIVQMDRLKEGAKRYFVKSGSSQVLADLGEVDMGDHKGLVDFVKWGATEYPSRRTLVVVWNHGSGWDKRRASSVDRGVSYDDSSGNNITTEQLGTSMAQIATHLGRKVDILGFDACLMNMIEVAYEVKANVSLMVGSEETEPGDGWAYSSWLRKLADNPAQPTRQVAAMMCDSYASSYWVQKATLSAIACGALDRLCGKLDLLVKAIQSDATGDAKQALAVAREKAARFAVVENADLFDLVGLFKGAARSAALKTAADAVLAEKPIAVVANAVHGFPLAPKGINGIAVYFPKAGGWWAGYRRLAFAKATQWDEMLQQVHGRPHEGANRFETLWGR